MYSHAVGFVNDETMEGENEQVEMIFCYLSINHLE